MDFERKIDGPCFVVGLEILDNMPHDRLYTTNRKSHSKEKFTHASIIGIDSAKLGCLDEILVEK